MLQDRYLVLQPSAEHLRSLIMSLISDLLHTSTFIPRLAKGNSTYLVRTIVTVLCLRKKISLNISANSVNFEFHQSDLERDEDLQLLQESIIERFDSVTTQLNAHRDQFLKHSAIWRDSKQSTLKRFLSGDDENYEPPLAQFKSQVRWKFINLH